MNVKAVVKVMSFHALLHVESARREAEKYRVMEKELFRMMGLILNNRNLQLDQKILAVNPDGPELCIYIGSDLGFCGAVNSSVAGKVSDGASADAIVMGKKIRRIPNQIFFTERENIEQRWDEIMEILADAVHRQKYSRIFLIYNHYHNMTSIECRRVQIFPIDMNKNRNPEQDEEAVDLKTVEQGDFVITGDATNMLQNMTLTYLGLEIRMAAVSSFAAENIARRNATTDSLKKIEEMEEQELWENRKERSQKAFKKVIDSFIKKKSRGSD